MFWCTWCTCTVTLHKTNWVGKYQDLFIGTKFCNICKFAIRYGAFYLIFVTIFLICLIAMILMISQGFTRKQFGRFTFARYVSAYWFVVLVSCRWSLCCCHLLADYAFLNLFFIIWAVMSETTVWLVLFHRMLATALPSRFCMYRNSNFTIALYEYIYIYIAWIM